MPARPKVVVHREMPGAYGFGKVRVIYRPKPPRNYKKIFFKFLAFFIYGTFFSFMYLSYSWSVPKLKLTQTLPFLRQVLSKFDKFREEKAEFFGKIFESERIDTEYYQKGNELNNLYTKLNSNKSEWITLEGETEEDLLYFQGYSHAKDRLLQLIYLKKFISGTLSEVLGSHYLTYDRLSLLFKFKKQAKIDYNLLNNNEKKLLQSYSNGINNYIIKYSCLYYNQINLFENSNHFFIKYENDIIFYWIYKIKYHFLDFFNTIWNNLKYSKALLSYSMNIPYDLIFLKFKLPLEDFEPEDSLAILRLFLYEFGHDWEDELLDSSTELLYGKKISQNLLKSKNFNNYKSLVKNLLMNNLENLNENNEELSSSFIHSFASIGGTVFGIGKNKNKNNQAELVADMVLNNKHQNFLYPNKLIGGSLNVTGLSLPGVPYVLTGQNKNGISWTLTQNLDIDTEDLFYLKNDSDNDIELEVEEYSIEVTSFYGKFYDPLTVVTAPSVGPDILPILDESLSSLLTKNLNIKNVFLSSLSLKMNLDLQFLMGLSHADKIGSINDENSLIKACSTLKSQALLVSYLDTSTGSVGIATTGSIPIRAINQENFKNEKMELLTKNNKWLGIENIINHHYLVPSADNIFVVSDTLERGKELLDRYISSDKETKLNELLLDSFSPSGYKSFTTIKKLLTHASQNSNDDDEIPYKKINNLVNNFDGYYNNASYTPSLIESMKLNAAKEYVENLGTLQFFHLGSNFTSVSRHHKNNLIYEQNFDDILSYFPSSTSTTSNQVHYIGYKYLRSSLEWILKTFIETDWNWGNLHMVMVDHLVYKSTPLYDEVLRFGDKLPAPGSHDSISKSYFTTSMGLFNFDTFYCQNNFVSSHRVNFKGNSIEISLPYTNNLKPANIVNNIEKFNNFFNPNQ